MGHELKSSASRKLGLTEGGRDYITTTQDQQEVGSSLVVQWLNLCASNAGGTGLMPGWGPKIPHAVQHGQIKITGRMPCQGYKWEIPGRQGTPSSGFQKRVPGEVTGLSR